VGFAVLARSSGGSPREIESYRTFSDFKTVFRKPWKEIK